MTKTKSIYENLSTISVKDKIERKGQLDYLSWANAWHMLKQNYPNAQRIVYEDQATGFNYFTDGRSAWVKVGIIIDSMEHIDYLPIMDFRNNAIPIDKVTSTEVNKTIQRSTTKAIAMHGLGLSLWTGEDVPELTTATKKPAPTTKSKTTKTAAKSDASANKMSIVVDDDNWPRVLSYINDNKSLGLKKICDSLERKYSIPAETKKHINELIKE